MAGRAAGRPAVLAIVAFLGVLAAVAGPAASVPDGVTGLAVKEATPRSVNITFVPSATQDIHHYNIYVSSRNDTNVSRLVAPPELGGGSPFYDAINVTSPADATALPVSRTPRVFFDNGTVAGAAERERIVAQRPYHVVPSDATRVYYKITNLEPNVTRYVAVTPVDAAMSENATVAPIPVVAADVPVERLPGNEGILLTLGAIMLALAAVFVVLWRRSGPASRPAYAYVAPAIVALAVLTFYPTAVGFVLSFTDRTLTFGRGGFDFNFIGADNYVRVFERPEFPLVAATTIIWTVVNVFFHVAVGLVLAVLLNRKIRGRPIYRTMFLLPWAIPSYISVLAWRGMFDLGGVIDTVFRENLQTPIDWLGSMPWALVAVITANVWLGIPFMMMVFSGGLQSISPELYEAADVDGLSRWQKFRRITLPLLKPTIVPASLLGFIWTFNMFNVIYLMTQGRPTVSLDVDAGATDILITYVYREGFQPFWRQGFAAAYSVVIFFMLLAFSLSYTRYTKALESFAGERAVRPAKPAYDRIARPFRTRIRDPILHALSPDQPETIGFPPALAALLVSLGVLELVYGAQVLGGMGTWNTLVATHGTAFAVIGFLQTVAGLLLIAGRTAGRRLGAWTAFLQVFAGLLAPTWTGVPFLLAAGGVAILVLLTRDWPQPATRRAPLAVAFERLAGGWSALLTSVPRGRGMRSLETLLLHAFLILFAIWSVFPLLMIIGTAFSNINSLGTVNIPGLGTVLTGTTPRWTTEAFLDVLVERPFGTWLWNSLRVAGGTALLGLFLALLAGYGFSRFSFRGKGGMMLSFLVVQMFPGAIILIPYYLLMQQLQGLDNHLGLIVAYSVTALPFMVWMLKGFFDTIPKELEEAAMVDGTTRFGAFWRVIFPLSVPAIAVTALFSFLAAWNEWLLAFTFMSKERSFTLPVGLSSLVQPPNIFWNEYAALSLIISLPVIVMFIAFQRYLISGLTKGAVKG